MEGLGSEEAAKIKRDIEKIKMLLKHMKKEAGLI